MEPITLSVISSHRPATLTKHLSLDGTGAPQARLSVFAKLTAQTAARYITMEELAELALEPTTGPKGEAALITPFESAGKTGKDAQGAMFAAVVIDHDDDDKTEAEIRALYGPEGLDVAYLAFTTSSHMQPKGDAPPMNRWKVIVPLAQPLGAEKATKLSAGIAYYLHTDAAQARKQQGFYAPNRTSQDAPYSAITDCLGSSEAWLDINEDSRFLQATKSGWEALQTAETDKATQAKPRPRSDALRASEGVIGKILEAYDLPRILETHGYRRKGHNLYLSPGSQTGMAGVRLLERDGKQVAYSHHGSSCQLSAMNHNGHSLDVADVLCALQYGGDFGRMIATEAKALDPDGNRQRQREFMQQQEGNLAWLEAGQPAPEAEGETPAAGSLWPEPQPLTASHAPEPYPLDALPGTVRAAVEEVASFVKAPVALVASSALAALSLACQAHIDAKRLEKLHGPVGLFLLTIADSGERKSTCDGFFTKTISDYEEAQAEAAKPALKDHKAAIEAWEAKRGGVKEKIRQLSKEQKPTAGMESALRDLEHDKPEPPRIPRLLYADATPEALAYGLAKQWPSGGVVSAEAGIVFGSHGMGKDSVMRNLALLNQLWDGKSLTIDRRTSESFTVRGARLTVALQVQEPALREFFSKSGALARGTGFLARFLVAWPGSTQGMRMIDTDAPDGPATWPHLAAFHRRIAAILDQPVPIDEDGALTPPMLPLTPDAKAAWVEYHNAIEGELVSGGELYDVRDVASKSADNAARLAALFQMFEYGTGAVRLDCFESASRIAAWHLTESRRFFGEIALPAELADAAKVDRWLIQYCQQERLEIVSRRHLQQHGPVRDKMRLEIAIKELEELDRLRVQKDGKRIDLAINPALIGSSPTLEKAA